MASSSFYSGSSQDATNVNAVEDSKNAAALSEAAAAASAAASANSAASGADSATTATTKASESATSATASATSASASQASRLASEAAKVASEAAKTASETARDAAASSSTAATASQAAASSSETNAANSAAAALASKNAAATSAATAATEAANSATSAAASEVSNVASGVAKVAAETAETNAETAQAASEAARDAAAVSQAAAATSENNAASSAATAATQAGVATTKAGEAVGWATAAASSASSAQASKDAALAALDSFDDRYLGQKTADPTVDNDGDALVSGALYFNTTDDIMKVYDGSQWVAAYASLSGAMLSVNNLSDVASISASRTNLGLGTAATTASTDYATAAQGTLAGSAVQPNDSPTFGSVTVTGTVDGRDVSADGTKLDGIEAGADVTDTTNVTTAGALMDSELTNITAVKALDQGVATTDDPTFTNTQLAAIAATITDTAVDVFVYDTSKDSDGGAWRKRTQGTSWYNETLNTATRGSRKEFPAVAVIVAESSQVTIYDGDDPDLPMWAVLDANTTLTSVFARNGLVCPTSASAGVVCWNFVSETLLRYISTGKQSHIWTRDVTGSNFVTVDATAGIVSNVVNDVAMTVLPNAPIDAATGLPVPTIAVATDGGVSVIKDDGTVVDLKTTNTYTGANKIEFTKENKLAFSAQNSGGQQAYYNYVVDSIPSADETFSNWRGNSERVYETLVGTVQYSAVVLNPITYTNSGANVVDATPTDYGLASGFNSRLTAILETSEINDKNAGAYITSDYNTGWMNGDIKLATLSDTDATNITGSELVTNGTFDTDTSGWTDWDNITNPSAASQSGGKGILDGSVATPSDAKQDISVVAGKTYVVSLTMQNNSGGAGRLYISDGANYTYAFGSLSATSTEATFSKTITPTQSTVRLYAYNTGSGSATFDNISVRLAEEDRSVNGNGLQVFGTVTKSAVNTGADLVGYGGFSDNGNYFKQPYNSVLNFGTGDFSISLWHYHSDAALNDTIYFAGRGLYQVGCASDASYLWVINGNVLARSSAGSVIEQAWTHLTYARRKGATEIWVNGSLLATNTSTNSAVNVDHSTGELNVPLRTAAGDGNDLLSLLRISATAPSPEQIAKMYRDEAPLFQENSQATLYGSSDAVTALAYDDTTELLHVGTSAGRSVFQGLRRVDNTTDAVGAAISASNGLVAED